MILLMTEFVSIIIVIYYLFVDHKLFKQKIRNYFILILIMHVLIVPFAVWFVAFMLGIESKSILHFEQGFFGTCLLLLFAYACWQSKSPFIWATTKCIGALLNILVLASNDFRMPAKSPPELEPTDYRHVRIDDNTRLYFLTDIIPTDGGHASIGDVLITLSGYVLLMEARQWRRKLTKSSSR